MFDRDNRLFPRQQDPEAAQVIHESYIVFPHLQPFADPTRLTPAEASDSLYRTPLFLLLSQGPPAKFALRLQYNATGGGDRSTLNLNALQLRENSEQLFVGGRKLVRGVDYSISYDVGQVTFLNPDALFGSGIGAGHGAVRGAGPLRRGADDDPRHGHPLLARRAGRDQPDRACTSASRAPSPGPPLGLRGVGQPHRRRQHRAALQARRGSPAS